MKINFTLDELVSKTQEVLEDTKYNLKNTRHPAKKRSEETAVAFWTAIHDHLVTYRSLLKDSTIS
jgi:hypothetical protein